MKLKEFRILNNVKLANISAKTGIAIPTLSLYEAGNVPIMLEHAFSIEKEIGVHIDWSESLTVKQKFNILTEKYPLITVLNFFNRAFKQGENIGEPGIIINHYANLTNPGISEEIETTQHKCKQCEDQ
jgi:transcriptional regulator with XRE-family HTH domain